MEIVVYRQKSKEESTRGEMYIDGVKFCDTLEDEFRTKKVMGETRIPSGRYKLGFREFSKKQEREGNISNMTKKYRSKFDWFFNHIEVKDIPNFSFVYIHVGNYEEDTDACLLVGHGFTDYDNESAIWKSKPAFEAFYKTVSPVLQSGEDVWITYVDHPDDKPVNE